MMNVIFNENEFDGEPFVTVTLSAPEVSSIFSALCSAAAEHSKRVQESIESGENKNVSGWWGMEAQAKSHEELGRWSMVDDLLGEKFWKWVDAVESEDD